jgi:hypothetical protein
MLYKTIILELLKQRPEIYQSLRKKRLLLTTLDRLAINLKTSHEAFKEQIFRTRPDCDTNQIASEALEMALQDLLLEALPNDSPPDEAETFSLDEAMAFVRHPTSAE